MNTLSQIKRSGNWKIENEFGMVICRILRDDFDTYDEAEETARHILYLLNNQ